VPPYTSIFARQQHFTKQDLCSILNLDASKELDDLAIWRAYRKRALRFHPDKQVRYAQAFPEEICNLLMTDIDKAKDRLIAREYGDKPDSSWFFEVLAELESIKDGTSWVPNVVWLISFLSNELFGAFFLALFYQEELFLKLILKQSIREELQQLSEVTSLINPILAIISNFGETEEDIDRDLQTLRNALAGRFTDDDQMERFLAEIKRAATKLKEMVTDDFKKQIENIISFWPDYLLTALTWKQLIGVYLSSLILTSTSLPYFFKALNNLAEITLIHKGIVTSALLALPAAILAILLLPVNMVIQFGAQLIWIMLKALYQVVTNGYKLLSNVLHLLTFKLYDNDDSFLQRVFSIFETILNLTLRLAINVVLEIIDVVFHIVTSYSPMSALLDWCNRSVDHFLVKISPYTNYQVVASEAQVQPHGFFSANQMESDSNSDDPWLEALLANLSADDTHQNDIAPPAR